MTSMLNMQKPIGTHAARATSLKELIPLAISHY